MKECPENYQWSKEYSFLISFTPGPSVLSAMWWEKMDNFSEMSCTLLNIPQVSIHSRQFKPIFDISKLCQNLNEFIKTKQVAKNKFKHNICMYYHFEVHWKNSMFSSYDIIIALFLKSIILDAKHEKNCQKQPRLFFI